MPIHILVIDDDPAVTELLVLLLKAHGFEASAVNRATEGVELIRTNKPELVILDLMMPEMDGWEACRVIRSFSNIPIVILSALNDPSMVAKVLDLGADDFLTKPTSSAVMIAHINKLVRRTGRLRPADAAPPLLSGTQPLPSS
ncbi:MAG TPA: response regulator [Anaerolineales bacterium]|jgi:DNA-binding response OmpR family regulator